MLPVGDFAWYDQVLTHSLTFGVIAQRFASTLFGMARGASHNCCGGEHSKGQYAQELTKLVRYQLALINMVTAARQLRTQAA